MLCGKCSLAYSIKLWQQSKHQQRNMQYLLTPALHPDLTKFEISHGTTISGQNRTLAAITGQWLPACLPSANLTVFSMMLLTIIIVGLPLVVLLGPDQSYLDRQGRAGLARMQ